MKLAVVPRSGREEVFGKEEWLALGKFCIVFFNSICQMILQNIVQTHIPHPLYIIFLFAPRFLIFYKIKICSSIELFISFSAILPHKRKNAFEFNQQFYQTFLLKILLLLYKLVHPWIFCIFAPCGSSFFKQFFISFRYNLSIIQSFQAHFIISINHS